MIIKISVYEKELIHMKYHIIKMIQAKKYHEEKKIQGRLKYQII